MKLIRWTRAYLLPGFWLTCACSNAGLPDDKVDEDPPPSVMDGQKDQSRVTSVGFPLSYGATIIPRACRADELNVDGYLGAREISLDGDLSDWEGHKYWIEDPAGDARAASDIVKVAVGYRVAEVYLGVQTNAAPGDTYVELGVASINDKKQYFEESKRFLRIRNGVPELMQNGQWQTPGDPSLIQTAQSANAVEIKLNDFFVGEVTARPLWWVRVSTRIDDEFSDHSSVVYFPSTASTDEKRFDIRACEMTQGGLPVRLTLLRDRGVDDKSAEEISGLARVAFERATKILGVENMTHQGFSVLVTKNDIKVAPEVQDNAPIQKKNLVHRLSLANGTKQATEGGLRENLYYDLLRYFMESMLVGKQPEYDAYVHSSMTQAFLARATEDELGIYNWLVLYWQDLQPFLAASDLTPDGKARGLGILLNHFLQIDTIKNSWLAPAMGAGLESFWDSLFAVAGDDEKLLLESLRPGWFTTEPYGENFTPGLLKDKDDDGLPELFELRYGTDPQNFDSDKDGWSDLAEIVSGTNPKNSASHPNQIFADGSFGDWRSLLLAEKINEDRDEATKECEGVGNISFHAAIAERDRLLIGAQVLGASLGDVPVSWEIMVDIPGADRKYMLRAQSGKRGYQIHEGKTGVLVKSYDTPMPLGKSAVEVLFSVQDLGLKADLRESNAVMLRIWTTLEKGSRFHCDDTPWFAPLVKSF